MVIALAGNPNAGKTTLFNALTGDNQLVGNWPGVTVEKKEGGWKGDPAVRILDLPGVYSLSPYTPEEAVARQALTQRPPDGILNLLDGTSLERSLYLTTQLLELGIPTVVAVNRADLLARRGARLDLDLLSQKLGCPVLSLSALKGTGAEEAVARLLEQIRRKQAPLPRPLFPRQVEGALADLDRLCAQALPQQGRRWHLVKCFEGEVQAMEALSLPLALRQRLDVVVKACEARLDQDRDLLIAAGRYALAGELARRGVTGAGGQGGLTRRLDRLFLHKILALPLFFLVLFGMFWFSISLVGGWAEGWVAGFFSGAWSLLGRTMPGGIPLLGYALDKAGCLPWVRSLLVDGVVAGVGSVLVFLPQLFALFLCLTFLEGCGYLSRGAYLLDKGMRRFGLSGKSVVPYVLACGCGVPGILACRTIRRESCRRLTALTATFLPCGAKLPVIALMAGQVLPGGWWAAPLAYLAGAGAALFSGWLLAGSRWFPKEDLPFLLELPDYRLPRPADLLRGSGRRLGEFLKKAGSLLLLASVALWFAANFGWGTEGFGYLAGTELEASLLAGLGGLFAPLFAPLGWGDWRAAVACLSGLLAKESIVSALAVLSPGGLPAALLAPPAALSFLLFNLLCAPCLAALAALGQTVASRGHFWLAAAYQTGFAWVVSLGVYQVGTLAARVFLP